MHVPDPWLTPAADAWIELSARLQRVVTARCRRTDVVVRIAPDAVDDAVDDKAWSGCYRHDLAEVRLDARQVLDRGSDDPRHIDLSSAADRIGHPLLTGTVCLAVAHAARTTWDPPAGAAPPLTRAVHLLERLRVVAGHLRAHRADRRWLRAAARTLAPGEPVWAAAGAIGLSVAGVLTGREAEVARAGLAAALGEDRLRDVDGILREAIALADGEREALLRNAEALAAVLCPTGALGDGTADRGDPGGGTGPGAALDRAAREASEPVRFPKAATSVERVRREVEKAERQHARAAARATFQVSRPATGVAHRAPDPALRRQAHALTGALRRARYRAPLVTQSSRTLPPGRLLLPEAMRREAQRAAGAEVSARPWLRAQRREVEQPPLRVGLSWDISRSQSPLHGRMADLAWALAWAMAHIDGELAAVAWNSATHPVAWPGRVPDAVVEPPCQGGSSACPQSLRALDGALDLRGSTGARLAIVATDGRLPNRRFVRDEVRSLAGSGVIVLWVTPEPDPRRPAEASAVVLADPDSLVTALGSAVCRALAMAS